MNQNSHGIWYNNWGLANCWMRFLRMEKNGCLEYCDFHSAAGFRPIEYVGTIPIFFFVQIIGHVWSFLHVARDLLHESEYRKGIRLSINLIGTKESVLTGFSKSPGKDNKHWIGPFDHRMMGNGWRDLICRDVNLQMQFKLVLNQMDEKAAWMIAVQIADHLTLAYNHKSTPRCFNFGTDIFPWSEYAPPQ